MVQINAKQGLELNPTSSANAGCNSIFIDCSDNAFKTKNYSGAVNPLATPSDLNDLWEVILENSMGITQLSYSAAVADIPHTHLLVDMFSDSNGYNNSLCIADTTALFSTCVYTNANCVLTPSSQTWWLAGETCTSCTCISATWCCAGALCYSSCVASTCITANIQLLRCYYECTNFICLANYTSVTMNISQCLIAYHSVGSGDYTQLSVQLKFGPDYSITRTFNTTSGACCCLCNWLYCISFCKHPTAACWEIYCSGVCVGSTTCNCVCVCAQESILLYDPGCTYSMFSYTLSGNCLGTNSGIVTNIQCYTSPVKGVYFDYVGSIPIPDGNCVRVDVYDQNLVLLGSDIVPGTYTAVSPQTCCCVHYHIKMCNSCSTCRDVCIKDYAVAVDTV